LLVLYKCVRVTGETSYAFFSKSEYVIFLLCVVSTLEILLSIILIFIILFFSFLSKFFLQMIFYGFCLVFLFFVVFPVFFSFFGSPKFPLEVMWCSVFIYLVLHIILFSFVSIIEVFY
jgi:hypothetical protein